MTLLKSAVMWFLLCASMLASAVADPAQDKQYSTNVDTRGGLLPLIQVAVGDNGYISSDITLEHFKLTGKSARSAGLILKPLLNGETLVAAAYRLEVEGYTLESIAELAAFFQQYPKEVAKHHGIFAAGKDSRWACQPGSACVPFACVYGDQRIFRLYYFDDRFLSDGFVLVSRK